jgi:23S rRNA pseudouridine1911/1915/1917 synthase
VKFTVAGAEDRDRLDQFVARRCKCARAEARRLIEDGAVKVNGRRGVKGTLVSAGAEVEVDRSPPTADQKRPLPEPDRPLQLLHEDAQLVAANKPAGMPTHPLRVGERGTLANALVARHPECAQVPDDPREGGVAHRLDTDTSGVVLAARTREAWLALRRAFSTGQVEKEYWALVSGAPPDEGEIRAALAHAGDPRKVEAVSEYADHPVRARPAVTRFEVMARGADVALVRARTSTGRMHQIRAHLAHAGHPLVGDTLYGGPPAPTGLVGHFLHARAISFPHPATGDRLTIEAPLPEDRARLLEFLTSWISPVKFNKM